jgi:hypothetical protein
MQVVLTLKILACGRFIAQRVIIIVRQRRSDCLLVLDNLKQLSEFESQVYRLVNICIQVKALLIAVTRLEGEVAVSKLLVEHETLVDEFKLTQIFHGQDHW